MIRGTSKSTPSLFEPAEERDLFHFIAQDVQDVDENISVDYTLVQRSSKTPFTPQSGIDVHNGDLAFMFRANINILHEPSFLTHAKNGNPFAQYMAVKEAAEIVEKTLSNSNTAKK